MLELHSAFFSNNRKSFYTCLSDIQLKNVKIFGNKAVFCTGEEEVFAVGLYESEINGLKNIGDTLKEFHDEKLNTLL